MQEAQQAFQRMMETHQTYGWTFPAANTPAKVDEVSGGADRDSSLCEALESLTAGGNAPQQSSPHRAGASLQRALAEPPCAGAEEQRRPSVPLDAPTDDVGQLLQGFSLRHSPPSPKGSQPASTASGPPSAQRIGAYRPPSPSLQRLQTDVSASTVFGRAQEGVPSPQRGVLTGPLHARTEPLGSQALGSVDCGRVSAASPAREQQVIADFSQVSFQGNPSSPSRRPAGVLDRLGSRGGSLPPVSPSRASPTNVLSRLGLPSGVDPSVSPQRGPPESILDRLSISGRNPSASPPSRVSPARVLNQLSLAGDPVNLAHGPFEPPTGALDLMSVSGGNPSASPLNVPPVFNPIVHPTSHLASSPARNPANSVWARLGSPAQTTLPATHAPSANFARALEQSGTFSSAPRSMHPFAMPAPHSPLGSPGVGPPPGTAPAPFFQSQHLGPAPAYHGSSSFSLPSSPGHTTFQLQSSSSAPGFQASPHSPIQYRPDSTTVPHISAPTAQMSLNPPGCAPQEGAPAVRPELHGWSNVGAATPVSVQSPANVGVLGGQPSLGLPPPSPAQSLGHVGVLGGLPSRGSPLPAPAQSPGNEGLLRDQPSMPLPPSVPAQSPGSRGVPGGQPLMGLPPLVPAQSPGKEGVRSLGAHGSPSQQFTACKVPTDESLMPSNPSGSVPAQAGPAGLPHGWDKAEAVPGTPERSAASHAVLTYALPSPGATFQAPSFPSHGPGGSHSDAPAVGGLDGEQRPASHDTAPMVTGAPGGLALGAHDDALMPGGSHSGCSSPAQVSGEPAQSGSPQRVYVLGAKQRRKSTLRDRRLAKRLKVDPSNIANAALVEEVQRLEAEISVRPYIGFVFL